MEKTLTVNEGGLHKKSLTVEESDYILTGLVAIGLTSLLIGEKILPYLVAGVLITILGIKKLECYLVSPKK